MSVILECIGCREQKEFPAVIEYPVCPRCTEWEKKHHEEMQEQNILTPETIKHLTLSQAQRKLVWEKSGGRCWYCGVTLTPWNFHVDHYMPRSKGGGDDLENLVPACRNCNLEKKDRFWWDWKCELAVKFGLATTNWQRMSLLGEGIDITENIYDYEIPVAFFYDRNNPRLYEHLFYRYKGWVE